MSTINTNPINVNYPVPGVNNNSQGFRDNFASIVTNLNTAGTEITDLQNKVVVKQALIGTTVNNDMANTLISNASTRSFRATTYNLGNAISGTVLVNVSLGDVQYGTIAGNTIVNFGSWAPTGTQSNVQLSLAVSNAEAVISFPAALTISNNSGVTTLENFANVAGIPTVTVPNGVTQLNYLISSTDCGVTLSIQPINRPRQTTEIFERLITPTGFQGDVNGDIAVGPSFNQLNISNTTTTSNIFTTIGNTVQLYTDLPIVFTGTAFGGPSLGTTYYVRNVVSSNTFTVSSTVGGANLSLTTANAAAGVMYANPVSYLYVSTDAYNSTAYPKNVISTTVTTNVVTLNNTSSLVVNSPIVFTANIGGLYANTVYYIKTISSPNVTVSQSRTNGVADTVVTLSSNTTATTANVYVGNDIWKRIVLNSW
jgi:hypothetical protein